MAKQFYNFTGGVSISDAEINDWLRQVRNKYLTGSKHYSISSGDTLVLMLAWEDTVDFVVSNSCGYSRISFWGDDLSNLENWQPEYERPNPIKTLRPAWS